MGFFEQLKEGLQKTRKGITEKIDKMLISFGKIDDDLFGELEEILITSDVGINTTVKIMENLKKRVKDDKITDPRMIKDLLKNKNITFSHLARGIPIGTSIMYAGVKSISEAIKGREKIID